MEESDGQDSSIAVITLTISHIFNNTLNLPFVAYPYTLCTTYLKSKQNSEFKINIKFARGFRKV